MNKFKKLIVIAMLFVFAGTSMAYGFMDTRNHWSEDTVDLGIQNSLTNGFPDNTFKPDNTVTEAQFLALLIRTFTDVTDNPSTCYLPYYELARTNNYPVTNRHDSVILRSQVAEIVTGTQGDNLSGDKAIAYLLARGLAKGKIAGNVSFQVSIFPVPHSDPCGICFTQQQSNGH